MESEIKLSVRSRLVAAIIIIIAAALVGGCGYFTAPSGALARGRHDMTVGHYRQAMRRFRQAAAKGNGDAMNNIGVLYDRGEGVPRDYAKAMAWFRKAAAKGDGLAMYAIGLDYYNGMGVPQDENKALTWMRRAEAAGGQAGVLARKALSLIKGR